MTSTPSVSQSDNVAFDQLRWLGDQGARFTLPKDRTKGDKEGPDGERISTLEKGWQNKPHTLRAAEIHAAKGGNVGVLVGKHSNNIIALDRDIKFPATLALLGDQAHTVKVQRTNAPERGKLLYRWVGDELPPAKVWKEHSSDRHPALELISTGRHAIIPPSQYDGGDYELTDLEYGIRDLTPAELDGIWLLITGDWFYPKPKQDEPKATVDVATYRDAVKAAWPLDKILQHFGRDQAGTAKERGETRVLGNGGLLLSADGATWFCFADGVGGDALDLWSYCANGKRLDRNDKRGFWDILNTMADAAGIARPERQAETVNERKRKGKSTADDEDPEFVVSEKIINDLANWGYDFWLNDMDDSVWNGNRQMDDPQRAQLRVRARDAKYAVMKLLGALDDQVLALATERRKHPIREYLAALTWDGEDHIAKLASYLTDKHNVIVYADGTVKTVVHAFLYRWLISAVAKIHGDANAARDNKILVFAAEQGKGKSHLAGWLCPLLEFFVERHINPDNKDVSLLRARSWVWEIGELGATTRRADVEALKAHVTAATITERQAYGHFDTKKPCIASYVGTVNLDGVGFLTDTTGNRRFAVVELDSIDWDYAKAVDVKQVWAQAMHAWQVDPRSYRYSPEEISVQTANAEDHTETDPYGDMIASTFEIDKDGQGALSSTEALHFLRTYAGLSHGHDRQAGRELARALRRYWGITGRRSNGRTVYQGLRLADKWSNGRSDATPVNVAGIAAGDINL